MEKHLQINNLWARIFESENKTREVVIGVHGFAGDKESSVLIALANELNKENKTLVTFDLPSHGENDTNNVLNLNQCILSINDVLTYVKNNYKDTPISIFATSFGAFLTLCHLSNQDEVFHKIILRAPAIYMADVLENVILPEHEFSKNDLKNTINLGYAKPLLVNEQFLVDLKENNLENKKTTNQKLYILQGKKDTTVNPERNQYFFEKFYQNNHEFFYFENADHRFKNPGELEQIVSIAISILNNKA